MDPLFKVGDRVYIDPDSMAYDLVGDFQHEEATILEICDTSELSSILGLSTPYNEYMIRFQNGTEFFALEVELILIRPEKKETGFARFVKHHGL